MITATALLLDRCGLSHREAAGMLDVRLDTVRSWSIGRNPTPPGVVAELRKLYVAIEDAAEHALDMIEAQGETADAIEVGLARDDDEARRLGWPCVGAHAAMLGLVVAWADRPVRVVPLSVSATT